MGTEYYFACRTHKKRIDGTKLIDHWKDIIHDFIMTHCEGGIHHNWIECKFFIMEETCYCYTEHNRDGPCTCGYDYDVWEPKKKENLFNRLWRKNKWNLNN